MQDPAPPNTDAPTAELLVNETTNDPPGVALEGTSKSGKGLDVLIERFLSRHPRFSGTVGMLGATSVVLGYLATAVGHIKTLRTTIYVQFGEEVMHAIHVGMLCVVVVLLVAGFTMAIIALDRRFVRIRTPRWRRGILGTMALLALSLTILSACVFAPDSPTTIAKLTDTSDDWRKHLLSIQNQDGGLRYNKVERDVDSQAWTTAQILAAVLSRKDPLTANDAAVVRAALDFLRSVEAAVPGEGWGYFDYVPWGVTEIKATLNKPVFPAAR